MLMMLSLNQKHLAMFTQWRGKVSAGGDSGILISMGALFAKVVEHTGWTAVYGPVLSLAPARWRTGRFGDRYGSWTMGTMISGGVECILAVNLFCAWGFLPGSHNALLSAGIYCLTDGAWRTAIAVFNGNPAGTVLLELVNEASVAGRRSVWMWRHPQVNDAVTVDDKREEWQLKIESSRAKRDWDVGQLVLTNERYYRIESRAQVDGARPFIYLLRSLPAGYPSLRVLRYPPNEATEVPKL
jgi:hypothetical protein